MEYLFSNKKEARLFWKERRATVGQKRRKEAALALLEQLLPAEKPVLSFFSFGCEFFTHTLNHKLASSKLLILPRIAGDQLHLFWVEEGAALERHRLGMQEPLASQCKRASLCDVGLVLVPGLAFDQRGHRLGYGGGFYDRFLPTLPALRVGLGYREQLSSAPLPIQEGDFPLDKLLLL